MGLLQETEHQLKRRHAHGDIQRLDHQPGRAVTVTAEEICQALEEPVHQITVAVKRTLERCEPELAADLIESGMVLAGGGGLLRGLDTVLEEATGLKVTLAEDPSTCVARGTAEYLENLEEFKDSMDGSGGA